MTSLMDDFNCLSRIRKFLIFQYPIAYGKIDYVEEDKLKRLKQVLGWMEDMVSNAVIKFEKRLAVCLILKNDPKILE